MSKYVINENTLTDIGDAIRAKGGTNDLILVSDLADAITNLPTGGGGAEPIVLSGNCDYTCYGQLASNYLRLYGDTVSTKDITGASNMFKNNTNETIPFSINFKSNNNTNLSNMFQYNKYLTQVPEMTNVKPTMMYYMFEGCYMLRQFPEDFGKDWDWSYMESITSQYQGQQNSLVNNCNSLRKLPYELLKRGNPIVSNSYSIYSGLSSLWSLDEIIDLPFPHYNASWTSNAFSSTFNNNARMKELTFALQEGIPYVMNWKNQTIDLSKDVGYTTISFKDRILDYNSGITADKEVKDDATYQALKNDPDWFALDLNYSRYNHDSAVNTINSLPDCSATGSNIIKFKGAAGALTDGGAINTLTAEEIAVAAAKGWTVSLV